MTQQIEHNLRSGDTRVVTANTPPDGYSFSGWSGDTFYLNDPSADMAIITIPERNVEVSAEYTLNQECNLNYTILSINLEAGIISYQIISGILPIVVMVTGAETYSNTHISYGQYQLTGVVNGDYNFRMTDASNCIKEEGIVKCTTCPEGYIGYPGSCVKITEVAPNYYPSSFTLVKSSGNTLYCRYGTLIFSSWNFDGTGVYEQIGLSPANTYWANTPYPKGTTLGPLNRIGVWGSMMYANQKIGFSFIFNIAVGKLLYVGVSADDFFSLKLNGEEILLANSQILPGSGPLETFNIYPIYFPTGDNIVEIYGINSPVNPATIGAVIYDATKADLIAATNDADLGSKILWSSLSMIGEPLLYEYSPTGGYHGYVCPTGYATKDLDGVISCQLKETINCP